jgi:hypothetical protein
VVAALLVSAGIGVLVIALVVRSAWHRAADEDDSGHDG